ncbi:hypothetical protein GF322_04570 [Candidatus Dependentiae bacterium]|nr:hypothetical protein [Candidatus Dependentiae bacterium]
MKIKILGTRGEIKPSAPYHSKYSGILIDNKIMIDIGEKEFLKYKPQVIFITHLHPDHAFFTRDKKHFYEIKIPTYAPEKYENNFVQILKKPKTFLGYKITPIPTEHSLKVKSQAYLIEKGKQKILYTGDMFWIKKQYQKKIPKLSLVITEGSYINKGGRIIKTKNSKPYGHTGIPNLINLFKPYTKSILLMHFGSWFYNYGAKKARNKLKQLGKENNINIIIGYDGMDLDLSHITD